MGLGQIEVRNFKEVTRKTFTTVRTQIFKTNYDFKIFDNSFFLSRRLAPHSLKVVGINTKHEVLHSETTVKFCQSEGTNINFSGSYMKFL